MVTGGDSLTVKDNVDRIRMSHSKHLFDEVKPRSANGVDPFLTEVEAEKYEKHELPCAR